MASEFPIQKGEGKKNNKHLNLRLPKELYDKLRVLAVESKRSINSEVLKLLEEFIEENQVDDKKSS
jgi:hypothetical protein